jgi:1-acyl-sn-glycerol-3-phosphate acyltransferase
VSLVKPPLFLLTRRTWLGMENIPTDGPVIIVAAHISHADPLVVAHFVYDSGRWPRFLAKDSLFRLPVIGPILRVDQQIPVSRGSLDAARALDQAVAGVRDGGAVIVYPEGTTTREPDLWPMRGKTGAARLWLATGATVIPIATWGPQRIFDPRTKKLRLRPRTPVTVVAGPPLDLSRFSGATPTVATLTEMTDVIMVALRDLLAPIRGGTPPPLWTRPAQTIASPQMSPTGPQMPAPQASPTEPQMPAPQASPTEPEMPASPAETSETH